MPGGTLNTRGFRHERGACGKLAANAHAGQEAV